MLLFLLIAIIAILALFGARLFVIMGLGTMLCFVFFVDGGFDLNSLVRIVSKMESITTKNVFLAIPFFIGAGTVMTRGGIAQRLITLAFALLGWMPGGLAIAAIAACMVFASISGSSPVTLIAVGTIMFPAMQASRYPENFSLGLIMTAGSLGCLLPPSLAMIIYAISVSGSASVDPTELFLAGLIPAFLISIVLGIWGAWVGRDLDRFPFSWESVWYAVKDGSWALGLPVIVLGGIYSGAFTPTEAGAVALIYSVFVTTFVYQNLKMKDILPIFSEAGTLIGSLLLIVVLSFGLNDFLAKIQAEKLIGDWLVGMNLNAWQYLLIVNVVLIVLGALMDSISATLIFAPLLAPLAVEVYGLDPLHFGIVFVVNMEIGYLAPPIATNLFVAAAVFKKPFEQVVRAIMFPLAIVCLALVVFMYVPTLSLAMVNAKRGEPVYVPFPWKAEKHDPATSPDSSKPVPTPRSSGLNLQELMKKNKQNLQSTPTDASSQPPAQESKPKRGLNLQELMRKNKENLALPTPDPNAPPPSEETLQLLRDGDSEQSPAPNPFTDADVYVEPPAATATPAEE